VRARPTLSSMQKVGCQRAASRVGCRGSVVVAPAAGPVVYCKTRGCPQGCICDDCCGHETDVPSVERVSSRPVTAWQALIGACHTTSPRRHHRCSRGRKLTKSQITPAKGIGATEAWNWFQTLTGLRRFFKCRCALVFLGAIAAFVSLIDVNGSRPSRTHQSDRALRSRPLCGWKPAWHFVRSRAVRAC